MRQLKTRSRVKLSKGVKGQRLRTRRSIKAVPPLDRNKLIEAMWAPSGLPHYR